jgi:predicted nucleic acid-binding protein
MLTCESVLAEACYLLRSLPGSAEKVMKMIQANGLALPFCLSDHSATVAALTSKYSNVPMSLADACLVRMAEIHDRCAVLTIDADFRLYRKNGRQVIPVVRPC